VTATPGGIVVSTGSSASTITVTVKDANGNPVSGATVALSATPTTGNMLTQPVGATGGSGEATGTLSSSVAGTKTVTASVDQTVTVAQTATETVTAAGTTTTITGQTPNPSGVGQAIAVTYTVTSTGRTPAGKVSA